MGMRFIKAAIRGFIIGSTVSFLISSDRLIPHYIGVDSSLKTYVSEWMALAKDHKVSFNHTVSIGFASIYDEKSHAVGLTHYGKFFREIDLDISYWSKATEITKRMLIFHELGHAYCYRTHDYGEDREYENNEKADGNGFYRDHCPVSLMYPSIIGDDCVMAHYQEYVDEIFQRCEPY